MRMCSLCLKESNLVFRNETKQVICNECREKCQLKDEFFIPVITFNTHLDEINDSLKTARWEATGGFRIWCQYEGKDCTAKERQLEEDRRLEKYARLRIEKELITRKIFDSPITVN